MRSMSNLEYKYIVEELREIEGKRLDKIYQHGDGRFRLKLRGTDIVCELGVRINSTKYIEKAGEPTPFIVALRKRISNSIVREVRQQGADRVVVFELEKERRFSLVLEMFSQGNMVLVNDRGRTELCLRRESWKDRLIREKREYSFPEGSPLGFTPGAEQLKQLLDERYAAACLSEVPLGMDYIKEAMGRAGVDEKKKGSELGEEEVQKIALEIRGIVENAKPVLYLKEGKKVDFSLANLGKYEEMEKREVESFSMLLDEFYGPPEEKEVGGKRKKNKSDKVKIKLEKQKETMEKLKEKERRYKEVGDRIYEKYQDVEKIIRHIRKRRKEKASWKEIEKELDEWGVKINKKKGTASIDL